MDLNSKLVEKIKSTDNAITDVQSTAVHVTQYTLFVCACVCARLEFIIIPKPDLAELLPTSRVDSSSALKSSCSRRELEGKEGGVKVTLWFVGL